MSNYVRKPSPFEIFWGQGLPDATASLEACYG